MDSQAKEKEIFPRLIKEIRTQRGLTQAEFGQMFDPPVSQQTVAGWERGENVPARKYWPKIAALADMELGQFYEYIGTGFNSTASLLEEIILKIKSLAPKELEVVTRVAEQKWAEFGGVRPKANKQHFTLLKKGAAGWNRWREKNPDVRPELYGVDLSSLDALDLNRVDLSGADLREGQLQHVNLVKANLYSADLSGADLSGANLNGADLGYANLSHAHLNSSYLLSANLRWANLSGANLREANLNEANLKEANLSDADLTFADLRWAILVETNLERATLVNCSVYGASVWQPKLDGAKQSELNTSIHGDRVISEDTIYVDNLELAPVLYTIRNNPLLYENLRQRFQEEEKAIRYAQELVDDNGVDVPDGSRLYFDMKNRWCQVHQTGNSLYVKAFDTRKHSLLLEVIHGKILSYLRPGDLDNLKALVESEAGKKEVAEQNVYETGETSRIRESPVGETSVG